MSTVYLAHDPHFERDVAVKLLPAELSHHPTFRRRFEREAKVVAGLADPAIVPVYDFGEEKGQPFFVMRFMTGGSLADRLHQGPLSLAEAARILSRLAPALDEVHSHNVIHRDLKPSNILFDQRNDPYISDFGTVKMSKATTQLTDTGGAVGTPAYMSPEQIQGDVALDGRSDIYTLGIILYEMLSGKHPFQSNTPIAVAVKHMFEPAPRILDAQPGLPVEVQTIINTAMSKLRQDRYPTAVAFSQALQSLVPPAAAADAAEEPVVVSPPEPPHGRRQALIISNSEYSDPILARLIKHPANVHRLVDVLGDPEIGGFDDVTTLVDETADNIRRSIAHFFAECGKEDLLLLYVVGHAAINGEDKLYLTARDTEHNLLRGTAIPAAYIAEVMDESNSWQQVLILDCTFSNAGHRQSHELVGRVVNTEETFTRQNGHKRVILAAIDRPQYEWNEDTVTGSALPSLFTHYFVEGLKSGAADADQNGRISVDEAFNYVYEQLRHKTATQPGAAPRKWVSYAYEDKSNIVIAQNAQLKPATPAAPVPARNLTSPATLPGKKRLLWLAAGMLTIILLIGGGWSWYNQANTPAVSAAILPTATHTATAVPTHTASPTATTPPTEPAAATPTATATATPPPTPTATAVPVTDTLTNTLATAQLASSIYSEPDTGAAELTFIGIGETVTVLGRSEEGEWLFVQTEEGTAGFVFAPRMAWSGEFEALPVILEIISTDPGSPGSCGNQPCASLTLDLYPLPGSRCENGRYYRTVFMQGQGGNGRFTYYWKGQKMAGPLAEEGFGFEVSSADGSAVIGMGKVVSGDGQTVEKELFVSDFACK